MKNSTVYHVMTRPKLFAGLPLDYMVIAFAVSLGIGGFSGILYFENGLGAVVGTLPIALCFWVVGYFMTKKDPEFFTIWLRSCFNIGDVVSFSGKRDYEP